MPVSSRSGTWSWSGIAAAARRVVDSLAGGKARRGPRDVTGEMARLVRRAGHGGGTTRRVSAEMGTLVLLAPSDGIVVTARPEELVGQWVGLGEPLARAGTARVARAPDRAWPTREPGWCGLGSRSGASSMPTVPDRSAPELSGVAPAAGPDGAVEARVTVTARRRRRPGMTGEASVTLRNSNLWGSLWWGVRRRIRSDLLL